MSKSRLIGVELDESVENLTPQTEYERAVAISDLLEKNSFQPSGDEQGPYKLKLSLIDKKLVFDILGEDDNPVALHILSLTPFRRVIRDYYLICDSYHEATRSATPSKIEAIDMGRRGLHNEGSQVLLDRLSGKIDMDFETARRLFTLLCVLHWRGEHG